MADLGDLEALLRSAGLRVTQPRLAVVAVLERARHEGGHLTVAEVAERSREILGRVSPQTVYDCLEAMTEAGIVRRVDLPGSPARFETRVGDSHHHRVCDRCGAVSNVDCAGAEDPCRDHAEGGGFRVLGAEVVFHGLCATCATSG